MTPKRPANQKARDLKAKLEALAERGINGEKTSAATKLKRLLARVDFTTEDPTETPDIFAGITAAKCARYGAAPLHVYTFNQDETELASTVKWCLEHGSKIPCQFNGLQLQALTNSRGADELRTLALHLATSFRALWGQFAQLQPNARTVFLMGLYDGVMNDSRPAGVMLPNVHNQALPITKAKRKAVQVRPGLNLNPYAIALPLGARLRVSFDLPAITADLDQTIQKAIA
jgi:hypothetical protein